MADPFSIAASVAGLVTLADLVFGRVVKYTKSAKGAPREVGDLLQEVKEFSNILHQLSLVTRELEEPSPDDASDSTPSPFLKLHYIHDCQKILNQLERGLVDTNNSLQASSRLTKASARLKWPFSASDTKEMVQTIQRHKQTITAALSAESLAHLKLLLSKQEDTSKTLHEMRKTVNRILDIETKIFLDQEKQKVLDFFTKESKSQDEFEKNKNLRHHLTGLWFTEGDEFRAWYETPGSRVWITGIPGAGKSVLAAAIITECLHLNSTDSRKAVAYFFCTYQDERTHDTACILSSLATQLARQNETAFQILEKRRKELTSRGRRIENLGSKTLVDVLLEMSALFDHVFLIIDGLDECSSNTTGVLKDLKSLASPRQSQHRSTISTALLSRDEVQIRHFLGREFQHIDVEAHTEDIQLYVAAELTARQESMQLRIKDVTLRDHIITELVDGAKGM